MGALAEWFVGVVETRRGELGTDMFSAMLAPDEQGDSLSTAEAVAHAVLLVTAGFETTMSLITLAVWSLLTHSDQLGALRADPSLAAGTVEETLRFQPAALSTTRSTPHDLDVAGTTIPAGSNILCSVVAANRDPRRYDDPGALDIRRTDVRPLTFGAGAHACLGAALARLEGFPELRLAADDLTWQTQNPTVRRPVSLPVLVSHT
jgi:6-deoxyerythronolide B hydroxylase